MTKWNADPNGLVADLHMPSKGGCFSAFLAPAPSRASTAIAPVNPHMSAAPGSLKIGSERPLSPPMARATTELNAPAPSSTPTSAASAGINSAPTAAVPASSTPTFAPAAASIATPFTPLVIPKSTSPPPDAPTQQQNDPQANGGPSSPRPFVSATPSNLDSNSHTSPTRAISPPLSPSGQVYNSPFSAVPASQPLAISSSHRQAQNISPPHPVPSSAIPSTSTPLGQSPPVGMPTLQLHATLPPKLANTTPSQSAPNLFNSPAIVSPHTTQTATQTSTGAISSGPSSSQLSNTQPQSARAKMISMSDRRASRGSLVDETLTSSKVNKSLTGSSPAPLKPSSSPARVNVIQLVGVVRDKVGLAKRDKERKDREKYFDPVTNGWMFMEAPNFDDLIYDPNMMIIFYEFLKSIHAEENLIAWVEIELYKCSNAGREARRNLGVDLLVRYFEPTSKSLINIEGVNYKEILKDLNERPARDLFDGAARVLWDQLAFQCYLRFKDSESVRRLFEEPTLKGKKKELLKLAQKAVKTSSDNANFMSKLDELSRWRAGTVAFIPNVSDREFQLEDILYSSDLLVAFREYLNTLPNSAEYNDALAFWFEVEVWKTIVPRDNLKEVALQIYREFIASPPSGTPARLVMPAYDVKALEQELQERPDKNAFTRLQVYAWRRLKLEQFALFEGSDILTKFLDGNLPMRQNLPIVRHCENLNEHRAKVANDAQFKANLAKVLAKIRHKRQEVQGTNFELEVLLADKEYVGILCEFLDKRQARENLNFWAEAEYYKYMMTPTDKAAVAGRIWERFFSDKAEVHINVDVTDKTAIQQALKEPRDLNDDLFNTCQDTIATLITFDLLPKFCVSEQGQRLTKAAKRRAPNPNAATAFRNGGLQAVKDLRTWLGIDD